SIIFSRPFTWNVSFLEDTSCFIFGYGIATRWHPMSGKSCWILRPSHVLMSSGSRWSKSSTDTPKGTATTRTRSTSCSRWNSRTACSSTHDDQGCDNCLCSLDLRSLRAEPRSPGADLPCPLDSRDLVADCGFAHGIGLAELAGALSQRGRIPRWKPA